MNCPACGNKSQRGAAFCASCGAALPPGPPAGYGNTARATWIGAGISAAALTLALVGLNAAGILRLTGNRPEPTLRSTAEKAPPTTRKVQAGMPDDIRAWLEHLERIEKQRVALAKEQVRMLMIDASEFQATAYADSLKALLGEDPGSTEIPPEYDSKKKASNIVESVRPAWKSLAEEFEAVSPPEECMPIAAKYSQVLRETGAVTGDIIETMTTFGSEPSTAIDKLQGIMKSHTKQIDQPAIEVDQGVADICDKYDTRKWFDVVGNVGGGGSLYSPNMPGLGNLGGGLGG